MAKQTKEEVKVDGDAQSQNVLSGILQKNKGDHYNYVQNIYSKVSSGSLFLDAEISLTEGVHRFCGPAGAGKTSEACEVIRQFLKSEPKGKAFWVKAEGRLSDNVRLRSGVKFVFKEEEWTYGTCFVLESNTFELIINIINVFVDLFRVNGDKLAIVIDSVDGLKLKSDASKEFGSEKVAGPQKIMKAFLRESYYPIIKNGVICIAISQVSSTIAKDDYGPPALVSGGGGNALLHWANYILEFQGRNWGDNLLLKGPDTKFDKKDNPIIGHNARVRIKKSDKENEGVMVEIPIKHGREDGKSIWIEREIITFAEKWGLLVRGGAWYSFESSIAKDVKEKLNFELQAKIQGFNNMLVYFEENPALVQYLFNRIRAVEGK